MLASSLVLAVSTVTIGTDSVARGGQLATSQPTLALVVSKIVTQATGIASCSLPTILPNGSARNITGTLFGNIKIDLNLTWTLSYAYTVPLSAFSLIVTQRNILIGNMTNLSQTQTPTNTIGSFNLYPNIPVVAVISFSPTCVTPGSIAQLLYNDGTYSYTFNLP